MKGRPFLLYWQPSYADEAIAERWRLDHLGSAHLRRIAAGDTVYLATCRRGALSLVGRIVADTVLGREQARARLHRGETWDAPWFAFAPRGRGEVMRDVPMTLGMVGALRFAGTERDRLDLSTGRVYPQQLQTMRQLTARSAARLDRLWEASPKKPAAGIEPATC